jgi:hypothetical protein
MLPPRTSPREKIHCYTILTIIMATAKLTQIS